MRARVNCLLCLTGLRFMPNRLCALFRLADVVAFLFFAAVAYNAFGLLSR